MKFQYNAPKIVLFILVVFALDISSCKNESENQQVKEEVVEKEKEYQPFFKLSLAQWSLHKAIQNKEMSSFQFAEKSKEMGFEGVEYVTQLYTDEINELGMDKVLDSLLALSQKNDIQNVLIMVDGEGDLADPSEAKRNDAVEKHKKWVDAAEFLGCHSIRVNTFGTNEPDEWHTSVVDGLRKLSEYAAPKNINVIAENHGWLSSDADKLMSAINEVDMDNCGTLPDFGNWCIKRKEGERWGDCEEEYSDIYQGVELMMPKAKAVSAKSYNFDDEGNETKLDYPRLLKIVKEAGYDGYIGVEYEGSEKSEEEGIKATRDLLLKAAAEL